jgi:two-component system nitrogen regulation sensor histidine kinase NtrY
LWTKRASRERKFTFLLALVALGAGIATYATFSHTDFWASDSKTLLSILNVDLAILLLLALMIARSLTKVWAERKSGQASAKLHTRFVVLFSLLTLTPAVIVTVFSGFFFNMGLQTWFNDRVKTALKESTKVAEAYLAEHKKVVEASVSNMARDIASEFHFLAQNQNLFNTALDVHSEARNLDEALIFDSLNEIIARTRLSFALEFEVFAIEDLESARNKVIFLSNARGDRVRAFTKIPNVDAYLLVGRIIDPAVSKRIQEVESAVSNYKTLDHQRKYVELYFVLLFLAVSLLLLLIAIWVAIIFANRIAKPIGALINAAERVRQGDLNAHVNESLGQDEISLLLRSFNRMTGQLREQKEELLRANRVIDSRRQFIEDVLAGVSAGVIGLDEKLVVQIMNDPAYDLLGIDNPVIGNELTQVFPEVIALLNDFPKHETFVQDQIRIRRRGFMRTLLVRSVREMVNDEAKGFIVTFDDITALVQAQRKAAWADVARRIAHEIRNPLTPIQLSAEQLQRKYRSQIVQDKEKFESCVETIIRQVSHIGDMVKEFSNFARMPELKMQNEDIIKIVRQCIEQEKHANPEIKFDFQTDIKSLSFLCDSGQINQVMTNVLQNAIDAIKERLKSDTSEDLFGKIQVGIEYQEKSFTISIEDNGIGFPKENRDMLTEPYVTKKEKGTGLGLAIVKKIVEDHEGALFLDDSPTFGALVKMTFPLGRNDG